MPIYDYHCDHCGHTFSQVQSYTDATLETCPNCGKRPRKLMAMPAIVFKGGGWYKTDSRTAPKEQDQVPAAAKDPAKEPGKEPAKEPGKDPAKDAPKDAPKETKSSDGAAAKDTAAKAPASDAKSGSSKAEAASS